MVHDVPGAKVVPQVPGSEYGLLNPVVVPIVNASGAVSAGELFLAVTVL